jgi:hypothetical protein
MEWDFREGSDGLEIVEVASNVFHNSASPMDTNGNGELEPIDVLLVVNFLNRSSSMLLPSRVAGDESAALVDVSGDRWVTPLDALMVINSLNLELEEPRTPLIPADDSFTLELSASETVFSPIELDVLANDRGVGLRITELGKPLWGTVEVTASSSGEEATSVRYTPVELFEGVDSFFYTVADESGNLATAIVEIKYGKGLIGGPPLTIVAPERVEGVAPGASIEFRDAAGKGLISIDHGGDEEAMLGVLLSFAPNEAPFGLVVAGTLTSETGSRGNAYPEPGGGIWITGTEAEVEEVLAGLRYEPAKGFSAPNGFTINVLTFLYDTQGVSTGFASKGISVVVPVLPDAPVAASDYYEFSGLTGPLRLKVLANDLSPSGSSLRLVGLAQYPGWETLLISPQIGSSIAIDPVTDEIIYTPSPFTSYDSFVYIVSDAEGRLSQGRVALSLVDSPRLPDLLPDIRVDTRR